MGECLCREQGAAVRGLSSLRVSPLPPQVCLSYQVREEPEGSAAGLRGAVR